MDKIGILQSWNKKGFGVIVCPIANSRNVERYFLSSTRIDLGPVVPTAGLKVRFEVLPVDQKSGHLPAAIHAVFYEQAENAAELLGWSPKSADSVSGSTDKAVSK